MNPWDVAAGELLCTAAGLRVERLAPTGELPWGVLAGSAPVVDELLVLYVGRFVPKKGYDVVSAAAGPGYRLVFVGGDGPASDTSTYLGALTPDEVADVYRACDVFVCASDHEGFCVPLAEAMGHGVPIVAYGVTAVPETVADAGLVLPDKSPVHFASAVARAPLSKVMTTTAVSSSPDAFQPGATSASAVA